MLKKIFLITSLVLSSSIHSQIFDKKERCSKEIFLMTEIDTTNNKSKEYKALKCFNRGNFGIRLGLGISNFKYDSKTKTVIDNHISPNFDLSIAYDKWNLGLRFKPWTIDPQKEITVENKILPTIADLNIIKIDYYLGYSIDLKKLYSIEPYLGYNRTSLIVINEDELGETFTFDDKANGFILGTTFNKYFEFQDFSYVVAFLNLGYSTTNLSDIHPELGKGYFEYSIGIAIKGFNKKMSEKRIKN